jgi:hypothetical protein
MIGSHREAWLPVGDFHDRRKRIAGVLPGAGIQQVTDHFVQEKRFTKTDFPLKPACLVDTIENESFRTWLNEYGVSAACISRRRRLFARAAGESFMPYRAAELRLTKAIVSVAAGDPAAILTRVFGVKNGRRNPGRGP